MTYFDMLNFALLARKKTEKLIIKASQFVLWPRAWGMNHFSACRKISPLDFKFDFHYQASMLKLKVTSLVWVKRGLRLTVGRDKQIFEIEFDVTDEHNIFTLLSP